MKKIIYILLFLPLFGYSQVGVKAGYTSIKGGHAGAFYRSGDNIYLQTEFIGGLRGFKKTYQGSTYDHPIESIENTPYLQLPIQIGYQSECGFYGALGLSPGIFFTEKPVRTNSKKPKNKTTKFSALASAGYKYNSLLLSVRYDYVLNKEENYYGNLRTTGTETNALMMSINYLFE